MGRAAASRVGGDAGALDEDRAPGVVKPEHPLHALATYELSGYHRELEHAIGFYEKNHPTAPVLGDLRGALDDVIAEQADRAKLAAGA